MSYNLTFNNIIPSLWSIYPEFNMLKYVCKTGANQKRFQHIGLDDVILEPELKKWFINYFDFDTRYINYSWVGRKGLVNCIKFLKQSRTNHYPENYLHYLLIYNQQKCFDYVYKNGGRFLLSTQQYLVSKCSNLGYLPFLKYLIDDLKFKIGVNSCTQSAEGGHLDCLIYLRKECDAPLSHYTLIKAVQYNRYDCIRWLIKNNCFYTPDLVSNANNLKMLQFLHEECNIPILNCDDFVKKCSTKMLKYAHQKGGDLQNCCIKSATLNNLRSLQYCYENGDVLTLECMKSACRNDYNLDMIKYLIENNCPINIDCFVMLAARYHPEYIIYMYENGYCPIDLRITNAAATKCYKLLKFLLKHNFPHDITTWYNAVGSRELNSIKLLYKYNKDTTFMQQQKLRTKTCNRLASNFTCLKWAHENGFAWDETTCSEAAKFGDLTCLQYLHENGCPWDQRTTNACMSYNCSTCLDYAREHRCPGYEKTMMYMHYYNERYQ